MRRLALPIVLLLALLSAAPVATQPFGPPAPPILNGCTENALFAILNSTPGQECLKALPRASNVSSRFSVFCRQGRWGCCDKQAGYPNCKIEGAIPYQRLQRPPVAIQP